MQFACSVVQQPDGTWTANHDGAELGKVHARGSSRDEAVEKLRNEIRYRLELCPCTGESYQHIAINIVDTLQ